MPTAQHDMTANRDRERGSPVRLLTLTTLFPNAVRPRHGIFVAERLRRLCATGRVESTVVAAVPSFPGMYREQRQVSREERIAGLRVLHPRYFHLPRVGMRLQPVSLASAVLGALRAQGLGARDFDVIDAHYFYPDGVAAARVARALGLPLVISARGSDINLIGDIAFARRSMAAAAGQAQALVAVSQALASRMRQLGMGGQRLEVLRNGVDLDVFHPVPRADARRRLSLRNDGQLFAGVGNFVPEKRFEVVVRAMALVPEAELLLVGDGPLAGALKGLAQEIAPGRVHFMPNVPQAELRHVYSAADALALPSSREGWPNVLLEAMACGTPVAAADVGGVPEIVGPSAPGVRVSGATPEDWAAALSSLARAAHPASRVREYASTFGWDEIVARQCALYEEVRAQRQSGTSVGSTRMAGAHA